MKQQMSERYGIVYHSLEQGVLEAYITIARVQHISFEHTHTHTPTLTLSHSHSHNTHMLSFFIQGFLLSTSDDRKAVCYIVHPADVCYRAFLEEHSSDTRLTTSHYQQTSPRITLMIMMTCITKKGKLGVSRSLVGGISRGGHAVL